MQQYSRTIFTTDAFKIKKNSIEQEYKYKEDMIQREIENTEEKIRKLKDSNIGAGCLTHMIRRLFFLIAGIMTLFSIGLTVDGDGESIVLSVYGFTALFWVFYILMFIKYRRVMNAANERLAEIEKLTRNVKSMEYKADSLQKNYERSKKQVENDYHAHMQNQVDMLDSDLEGNILLNIKMKECPRCAEMIKEKAKVCRFCNYELV